MYTFSSCMSISIQCLPTYVWFQCTHLYYVNKDAIQGNPLLLFISETSNVTKYQSTSRLCYGVSPARSRITFIAIYKRHNENSVAVSFICKVCPLNMIKRATFLYYLFLWYYVPKMVLVVVKMGPIGQLSRQNQQH